LIYLYYLFYAELFVSTPYEERRKGFEYEERRFFRSRSLSEKSWWAVAAAKKIPPAIESIGQSKVIVKYAFLTLSLDRIQPQPVGDKSKLAPHDGSFSHC
jgi:hypothetical protein